VSQEPLRVSVRALVGYSVFQPDILPFSFQAMEMGRLGHLAWQGESAGQAETALVWEGSVEGQPVRVSGRMDLYEPAAAPPLIEEIKLAPSEVPQSPLPEHLLQAACYGHMLCEREGIDQVRLRVSYVTQMGELRAQFEEDWARQRLRASFFELLLPWVAWQKRLLAHLAARDASIAGLPFPYPAYRPGQREMATQVYTAIQRRQRLFAEMPTGTGKSAAVLFPALKALGQGLSRQVFCLTARGTQRIAMDKELRRMLADGLVIHALTLNARESLCPLDSPRCHPGHCERAGGHYLRQPAALQEALGHAIWDGERVLALSNRHQLCPFEFSLALCELADVVICDYNYAFDPQVRLSRVFDTTKRVTLLVDEAHNLPDRARDMLSGSLTHQRLTAFRREAGRLHGRAAPLYKAATALLRLLEAEDLLEEPERLLLAVQALVAQVGASFTPGGLHLLRDLVSLASALQRAREAGEDYAIYHLPGKQAQLHVLNLNPAPHLQAVTRGLSGCVFYSATLQPLGAMRALLGGEREDALLSLPSPFPVDHLLTLHYALNTRYRAREASLLPAARAILALYEARPGKMIAYFPSFAYLNAVRQVLLSISPRVPLNVQQGGMDEGQRLSFLADFTRDDQPLLGLCVLGGVFAEGVDLPGQALTSVAVVGVGLPQVNQLRDLYRTRMEEAMGDGFGFAYRYPGMHKVLQAAGRLIRSDTDRGVLLLLDDRYAQADYEALLPVHIQTERVQSIMEITRKAQAFWGHQQEGG